jgi:hypothetical protein
MDATKHRAMSDQPSQRKRSAPDRLPDGKPHAKLQKHDAPANQDATSTGHSAKKYSIGKSVNDIVPTPSQTATQTKVYNDKDSELYRQNVFMQITGMSSFDPDRSSMIIRGNREDRILTATQGQGIRTGETYLHETTGKLKYSLMYSWCTSRCLGLAHKVLLSSEYLLGSLRHILSRLFTSFAVSR